MKLFIAGSRSITDFDLEPYIPNGTNTIISGGAEGIDAIAEEYADRKKLSKIILQPEYEKYGRRAPIMRNRQMASECDEGLVIWDGKSKGTLNSVNELTKAAKSYRVVVVKPDID